MTNPTPSPYADVIPGHTVDQLEDAAPALDVVAAAGTPLSALASTDEDAADQEGQLERLEAHVELDGGESFDVTVGNRDFVAWDLVRSKRNWPAASEAPFLLNTFLAFAALKRTRQVSQTFESFEASVAFCKMTKGTAARPTR